MSGANVSYAITNYKLRLLYVFDTFMVNSHNSNDLIIIRVGNFNNFIVCLFFLF